MSAKVGDSKRFITGLLAIKLLPISFPKKGLCCWDFYLGAAVCCGGQFYLPILVRRTIKFTFKCNKLITIEHWCVGRLFVSKDFKGYFFYEIHFCYMYTELGKGSKIKKIKSNWNFPIGVSTQKIINKFYCRLLMFR